MDTPIYAELQQKLIDPEANNWGPSAPPEFAASLSEQVEREKAESAKAEHSKTESKKERKKPASRSGGRRHRAED